MKCNTRVGAPRIAHLAAVFTFLIVLAPLTGAQNKSPVTKSPKIPPRPKLVVLLVVDQMRADYVDKFRGQWTGGLKRLVEQGAWFRDAAYPYAAMETCVGHATVSTGAFPATHGMVANAWWDRKEQKMVTCTSDPNPSVKNVGYAGATPKGGDTAWRMAVPSFAEELKFQTGGATRVVTFSLKARAAITMAGHNADAVTWLDGGTWVTSTAYGTLPFMEERAKSHSAKADFGKTWSLSLPETDYWYSEKPLGAVPPDGWDLTFPHRLRNQAGVGEPDASYYEQWASSPYADTALTELAENAVDALKLGSSSGIDFLAIGYSPVDYVGHEFGPRSREIQDILLRLDKDLGSLFAHLDRKVGGGNYVVAVSADHGVAPIPEDMQKTGADAGVLHLPEVQERIERALESFSYAKPAVARISGSDLYFAPGVYEKLQADSNAMHLVIDAIRAVPGVAAVYRAEDLRDRPATQSPTLRAFANGYFPNRSGDLFILPKPYWLLGSTPLGKPRSYGTDHGVPYNYDQHVPVLLMGFGIQPGQYFQPVTPADIAPTFAALCGITLSSSDGRVLAEALKSSSGRPIASRPAQAPSPKQP